MFPSQFEVTTLATAHHAQELRSARERERVDRAHGRSEMAEPTDNPVPSLGGWRNLIRLLVQWHASATTADARR
jgi:hypothetical protein